MNQRQIKRQRYLDFLFLTILLFMIAACGSDTESATTPVAGVVPRVFVFPSGTDKRLISDERILQNNCDGTAEMSQTVTRQHTVQYTMEIGTGLTVSAEGKVGVPGVGEVGVGTEVAAHYKVGYGRQETVSRSQTVAAAPNSHIQHTIQQFEIWETGEVLIVVGDQNQRLPYSFRRDFSIEAIAPANVGGCITQATGQAESVSTKIPATPVRVSGNSGQLSSNITDCSGNAISDIWNGTDGSISHNYGFPVSETAWGATADPNKSIKDEALIFGPYIDLAPGQYKVTYHIKISGDESPNTPVARLNVAAYVDGIDNPNLVNRVISFGEVVDPDKFVDYEVRFVLSGCSTRVEFRVFYQNAGNITVERITLVKE